MGGRRNEQRNVGGLLGLFLNMNTEFLKLSIICSRTKSEDQFLYAKVHSTLVLSSLLASALSLRLLWRWH